MVDFDCVEPGRSPTSEADNILVPQQQATQLCRLCLQEIDEDKIFDIFAYECVVGDTDSKPLGEVLYELFQVRYDQNCTSLPHFVCQRCLEMVQAFGSFRFIVRQSEEQLQKRLELIKSNAFISDYDEQRPGLNGNPGQFEPDDECEIERINPDEEFESSEDDFSMESDSETEDEPKPVQNVTDITVAKPESPLPKSPQVLKHSTPTQNDVTPTKEAPPLVLTEHKNLEFTVTNTYLCQYCDMAFTTQPECLKHESGHDANLPYVCSFCRYHFGNRQILISHIKELHDPEKPYICGLCSKGFCRRSDLKKHTIVHTGVRPFSCPLCTKCFSRNTNLYKHMRIHSSVKPYICQKCPRSFTTGTDLLRHSRTHSEAKNFKCSKCPAAYSRKDKLVAHEQMHHRKEAEMALLQQTKGRLFQKEENMENIAMQIDPTIQMEQNQFKPLDEQQRLELQNLNLPYQLPTGFLQTPTLISSNVNITQSPGLQKPPMSTKTSHSRSHTCDICAKSFTRERDLHRHQALHLDTLFTCKACGQGFSRREKLARHELELHAPQYPCDICRIIFHKKEELDMHSRMHELQQNVALSTHQAVLNSAGVVQALAVDLPQAHLAAQTLAVASVPILPAIPLPPPQRPSEADMSFYSQMVPTMNLGFYSEAKPED